MEERQLIMKANKKSKSKKMKEEPECDVETSKQLNINISKAGTSNHSNSNLKTVNKHTRSDSQSNTLVDPEIKKIKMDYSVAKDPKVTDVYKSLFTSHDSEKKQDRAHWITYNPFYN